MSTSKRAKAARQEQHRKEKLKRQYEKQFASKPKKEKQFVEYKMETPYVRETPYYPSLKTSTAPDATGRREAQRYTGSLVKGIATMHKSNAVPVISQQEAEDISKMRRG